MAEAAVTAPESVLATDPFGIEVPGSERRVGRRLRDREQVVDHRPKDTEQLAGIPALVGEVVDVRHPQRVERTGSLERHDLNERVVYHVEGGPDPFRRRSSKLNV